jgi:hypothetical protein
MFQKPPVSNCRWQWKSPIKYKYQIFKSDPPHTTPHSMHPTTKVLNLYCHRPRTGILWYLIGTHSLTWNMLFKLTSRGWSFEVQPPGIMSLSLWWPDNSAMMLSPMCGSRPSHRRRLGVFTCLQKRHISTNMFTLILSYTVLAKSACNETNFMHSQLQFIESLHLCMFRAC